MALAVSPYDHYVWNLLCVCSDIILGRFIPELMIKYYAWIFNQVILCNTVCHNAFCSD